MNSLQAPDHWDFAMITHQRARAVERFGFSERQARFLVTVMLHSGVFLERQYCTFAGIVHGQKTTDFLRKLIDEKLAVAVSSGALHRGRLIHVRHKPLYAAIGQVDNRHRKPAELGRLIERVMLLDAVLDDRQLTWLGTEQDKLWHFKRSLGDRLRMDEFPRLTFGTRPRQTVRYFPDKMPIGMHPQEDHLVFLYLVTQRSTLGLSAVSREARGTVQSPPPVEAPAARAGRPTQSDTPLWSGGPGGVGHATGTLRRGRLTGAFPGVEERRGARWTGRCRGRQASRRAVPGAAVSSAVSGLATAGRACALERSVLHSQRQGEAGRDPVRVRRTHAPVHAPLSPGRQVMTLYRGTTSGTTCEKQVVPTGRAATRRREASELCGRAGVMRSQVADPADGRTPRHADASLSGGALCRPTAAAMVQRGGRERPHPAVSIVAPGPLRGVAHALRVGVWYGGGCAPIPCGNGAQSVRNVSLICRRRNVSSV